MWHPMGVSSAHLQLFLHGPQDHVILITQISLYVPSCVAWPVLIWKWTIDYNNNFKVALNRFWHKPLLWIAEITDTSIIIKVPDPMKEAPSAE